MPAAGGSRWSLEKQSGRKGSETEELIRRSQMFELNPEGMGELLKSCRQESNMIKFAFWEDLSGCFIKNRSEQARMEAKRPVRKLLPSSR